MNFSGPMPNHNKRVVLTGFDRFGGIPANPSQLLVEATPSFLSIKNYSAEIVRAVLPTRFEVAAAEIKNLLKQYRPDVCICIGVALKSQEVRLERCARNLNDTSAPDNAGVCSRTAYVEEFGPDIYVSPIDLEALCKELRQDSHVVSISENAGSYVCNQVYYAALHVIAEEKLPTACCFVHIPNLSQTGTGAEPSFCLESLFNLLHGILEFALRQGTK